VGTTAGLRLPRGLPSAGTVVVADDDAGFRQVLKAMLAGIAGTVIEAEDGAQALAAVGANQVDLVLADLGMPGTDGRTLLDRLPPGLPAIIITGSDIATPPRAAALLHKDNLTRERLAFAIRRASRTAR
jgi:CheY-like chemotaxis protein